ncbi:hypothetical protein [Celeribacter sp.]|uniref:hypothetical protein n=1 Tax=Celeribacter sp. TaxID=1890673 RepID=UPI003A955B08
MTRPISAAALLCALAMPSQAAEPMTAEEFDQYTRGKTLTYAEQGIPYGIEEYYPDKQVKWAFENGDCMSGFWYEKDQNICFIYEDGGPTQCWAFYLEENKLRAVFVGDSGTELYEAWTSDRPLQCEGAPPLV